MEYKFDGKPHALNKEWAYIITKYGDFHSNNGTCLKTIKNKVYREYAEYLYRFQKHKAIEHIMESFSQYTNMSSNVPDTEFIHRTPEQCTALNEYGSIALKFKRWGDDLDDEKA